MNTDRRKFLSALGLTSLGLAINPLETLGKSEGHNILNKLSEFELGDNSESFWRWVQQSYTASANLINLNNGGVCPQPKVVQETMETYNRLCNEAPSYYMWRVLDKGREALREKLANLAGCDKEEIVVNRNTTEAVETILFGLDLKKGDEIVLSKYDYPHMVQCCKQIAERNGVILKWVDFPVPCESDETIVNAFKAQITSKTKLVLVTHVINWTGQILPVRKIADAAHEANAEVVVDGAHSFAHLDFKIKDLNCDYFGTSLHKWLCAPFGTGMMYVKKEKIAKLWPAFAPPEPTSADIRKFESLGTRSLPLEFAIGKAIDFHEIIGTPRKQNRLHFLKNYWLEKALKNPKIKSYTSLDSRYGGAIASIAIEGIDNNVVSSKLQSRFYIHTTVVDIEQVSAVRITPNVYTTLEELDKLVDALNQIAA